MWRVTVVDDFTHECPPIEVNHSLAGANVAQTLNRLGRASKHVDLKRVRQRDGGECACSRLNPVCISVIARNVHEQPRNTLFLERGHGRIA